MVNYSTEELHVGEQPFPFELCRKAEQVGPLVLDHWWMNTRRLYGQRRRPAPNLQNITAYFWALCRQHRTAADPEVQESYLLANLVPWARSNAGRRIFADAHLTRPELLDSSTVEVQKNLEELLRKSRQDTLTLAAFNDRTADILGPPNLAAEIRDRYQEVVEDLLGEARAALGKDSCAGVKIAVAAWQQMMRGIGRRAGFGLDKQVLDILSYECRAALHRCYSAVWWDLLPHLALKHHLSPPSLRFLAFWHLDHCGAAEQGAHALFHLFHGHIFGLHPAGGTFLQSPIGRSLLGAWLQKPESEAAYGQLLHGMYVTLYHYSDLRDLGSTGRRKQPTSQSDDMMLHLENEVVGEAKRRRRLSIRSTDAR